MNNSSTVEVNVEDIMKEIRDEIKKNRPKEINSLSDAFREVEWQIEDNGYTNDLVSFESIPITSFTAMNNLEVQALWNTIQSAKQQSYVGSEFSMEGNGLKRAFKKASQKATRCIIIPLTSRINENNLSFFSCLEQAAALIDQQQQQIQELSEQLSILTKAVNGEVLKK